MSKLNLSVKMIRLLIAFTVLFSLVTYGQTESITLKESAHSLEELIPTDWELLDSKTGDLNKDGILDLVFAIANTDEKNLKPNDGFGIGPIDLNPRKLGIYFGTPSGTFRKQLVSNEFIILRETPSMDEPFEGFTISKKGVLSINFHIWYSAGSWSTSNHTYKFRFQNNAFVLIGYDSNEAHRASGETTDYSINFLSEKMKITRGNFSEDESESVEWINIYLDEPITIKTLKKPFEREFEGIRL